MSGPEKNHKTVFVFKFISGEAKNLNHLLKKLEFQL